MISLESTIARDSFVRAIDAFVDAIDMKSFGFSHVQCKEGQLDREEDTYTCPAGETLATNNVWYNHSSQVNSSPYGFRRYTTPAYKACTSRHTCTKQNQNGRAIDRSEYSSSKAVQSKITETANYRLCNVLLMKTERYIYHRKFLK